MKPRKPRASKVEVHWQKKRKPKPVALAKSKRRKLPASNPVKPSKHPMVNFLKQVENGSKLDPDVKTALIAGFQAGHCTPEKFSGREIAKVKTSDGVVKRMYACDVCGFVGVKESHT